MIETFLNKTENKKGSVTSFLQDILKEIDGIKFIYFTGSDVVRHALVQRIIEAYNKVSPVR